ncbi:hypothetical protein QYM36_001387, partial [Artemia franciscana]
MKAECQFVVNSANYFAEFIKKLCHDEPLIYFLFAQLRELLLVLSGHNEMNVEAVAKRQDATLFDDSNMKSLADIVLSYNYLKYAEKHHKKYFIMRHSIPKYNVRTERNNKRNNVDCKADNFDKLKMFGDKPENVPITTQRERKKDQEEAIRKKREADQEEAKRLEELGKRKEK